MRRSVCCAARSAAVRRGGSSFVWLNPLRLGATPLLPRLHSPLRNDIVLSSWTYSQRPPPYGGDLFRDPAFLRPFLEKDAFAGTCLPCCPVPTPAILKDRSLVVQILQRCPAFLRHRDIPPHFFTDRKFFEATVCGIRSDADALCLFSVALRNDAELVHQTLRRLYGRCWIQKGRSFVGRQLCDDKEFCLRVAEDVTKALNRIEFNQLSYRGLKSRRLLDLSHLSDCLQHDPAVVAAFCRLDGTNYSLRPHGRSFLLRTLKGLQRHRAVVHAACEALPSAVASVPRCLPARFELESSVPFIVQLLNLPSPFVLYGPASIHSNQPGGVLDCGHSATSKPGSSPMGRVRRFLVRRGTQDDLAVGPAL